MRWPNGSTTRPNISSSFGPRSAPTAGASTIHRGCDFTGIGQIRAVAAGTVVVTGTPGGWSNGGRQVWIQHDGFFSRSMHMASWAVSNGQHVEEGQYIGVQDTTGTATGSHLHLEITPGNWHTYNSGQVDPVAFIQARLTNGSVAGGSGSQTEQLQVDLTTLNYPLEADGDYGPATTAAVTQYQRDNGLEPDGVAGPITFAELAKDIGALQNDLRKIGYSITADGKSGPQTIGAIKDFQSKNGLEVDGLVGPNTRAKLNEKLALDTDGFNAIPNERSTGDIQRLVGANPDGIWGPATTASVKAWQSAHNLTADGVWGPASDAVGFPKAPAAYIPIDVDGQWGKATTTALQANLGLIQFLSADQIGVLNATTIKALQKAVGVPEAHWDGIMGSETIQYMQSSLGVHIDGQNGPLTITALQTLLNRNGKLLPVPFTPDAPPTKQPKPAAPTYPDAERWDISINSSKRTGKVQGLILHHNGTDPIPTAEDTWKRFNSLNDRSVSANWQVNNDGSAYEPVAPDDYRAWTTGIIDMQAVTIETQNQTVGPQWGISQAALLRIAKILAFAAKRYNFPIQMGEIGPDNTWIKPGLVGHNMTPAGKGTGTVCPGPSMAAQYAWILETARAINNLPPVVTPPIVIPPVDPPVVIPPLPAGKIIVDISFLENLKANQLSDADAIQDVLDGK